MIALPAMRGAKERRYLCELGASPEGISTEESDRKPRGLGLENRAVLRNARGLRAALQIKDGHRSIGPCRATLANILIRGEPEQGNMMGDVSK